MTAGVLLIIAGVWLVFQTLRGGLLDAVVGKVAK